MIVLTSHDGIKVTAVGRLAESDNVIAVSVPPNGATRFFCELHKQIFNIGGTCPICTGASADVTPVVTVVTATQSAEPAISEA